MVAKRLNSEIRQQYQLANPELNPDFIFAFPGYNVRNNELAESLDAASLTLDANVKKRTNSCYIFWRK